jgi:hypothetical protein
MADDGDLTKTWLQTCSIACPPIGATEVLDHRIGHRRLRFADEPKVPASILKGGWLLAHFSAVICR